MRNGAVISTAEGMRAILLLSANRQCYQVLGSLSALSALESEAASCQRKEAEAKSRHRDYQHQLEKIGRLKQRRDELLQLLHDKTDSESGSGQDKSDVAEGRDEADELTSALAYVSELKEKLEVYKMTGVSVVKTDQDSKMLCFTTSHRGVYLESYHLKLQRLASGSFRIVHHDLPPFVMFSCLSANLEVKDMQSAVRPLQERLAMFVARREDLKGAQGKFPDSFHVVESSAAFDYLCCHLDVSDSSQVEITLKYADLNHYLPSSVIAVMVKRDGKRVKEAIPQDVLDDLQSEFCTHYLSNALVHAVQLLRSCLHMHRHHAAENS